MHEKPAAPQAPVTAEPTTFILEISATPGGATVEEVVLTQQSATDALGRILMALDDLAAAGRPVAEGVPIMIRGQVEAGIRQFSNSPTIMVAVAGLRMAIPITIPALMQLQREIQAALKALKAEALH